jgi:hypothetical protein
MLIPRGEEDVFFEWAQELLRFVGCDNVMRFYNCCCCSAGALARTTFHESRELGVSGNLRHVSFILRAL